MSSARIMVVEDEYIVNADIQNTLKILGYEIAASVTTGEESIEQTADAKPDLVLMDIRLQGEMDGIEAAEQIRTLYNIPVVYLTAYSDENTLQRAKITEPYGYVTKPFEERELHTNIEIALHKHKMESELRESRQWFSTLLMSIGDAVIATDSDGNVNYMNPVAEYMTEWEEELALGRPLKDIFQIMDEETGEELTITDLSMVKNGSMVVRDDHILLAKDNLQRPISCSAAPILDENGESIGTVIVFKDITESKLAEQALKASEKFNRDLVNHSPLGIVYLDQAGKVVFINPAFIRIAGFSQEELKSALGKPLKKTLNLKYKRFERHIKRLISGESISIEDIELQSKSGRNFYLNAYGSPRLDSEEEVIGAVLMFLDITDYRELEANFRQAQKMEAIGALAGGIAHDFNNILTLIKGNTDLVLMKIDDEDPLRKYMERLQKTVVRGTELTKQLLLFGRRKLDQAEPTDLNKCIKDTILIVERAIDPRIEIDFEAKPDLWTVETDVGKMNQVFLNLFVNARDAMPEGGKLWINTENVTIDESFSRISRDAVPGDYVKISVGDTGVGISPEDIDHIFEPFYSTKSPEKGTGLGLAVVYGIVKGHNGWISIDSKLGEGTCFSIYIPRLEESTDKNEEVILEEPRGGNEVILLVDDDNEVRELGQTMLVQYGYKVLLAEDGEEAVTIYRWEKDNIDLVILDLYMPHKSGRDAFVEMLEMNPKVKVIIYSGFNKVSQIQEMLDMGAKKFIQKPYRMKQMMQVVREILDQAD